jgi:hypothetical protein
MELADFTTSWHFFATWKVMMAMRHSSSKLMSTSDEAALSVLYMFGD